MTGTLIFNSIKLYGYHGIHKEEALVGTFFTITIKAVLKADFAKELPNLENSVNYEALYNVFKKHLPTAGRPYRNRGFKYL
jgi:dihydroneopterin aldolase